MLSQAKEDCCQAYLEGALDVLGQVLEPPIVALPEVTLDGGTVEIREVSVMVGLTGDLEGRVLLEFDHPTALNVVSVMNFGEHFAELDRMARATLAELLNLIAGRAITLFSDRGGKLYLSPPMVMVGAGMSTSDQQAIHRLPLQTPCGEILINLSVRPTHSQANVPYATSASTNGRKGA